MKTMTRFLLCLYTAVIGIISLAIALLAFRKDLLDYAYGMFSNQILTNGTLVVVTAVISVVFVIFSLMLFIKAIRTDKPKRSVGRRTSIGEIRISLNAVLSISLTTVRRMSGVKEVRANVDEKNDKVSVNIRLVVFPDINIPVLSEEIQAKVKKAVEDSTGILVDEVKVSVDNIFSGPVYRPKITE